MLRSSRVSIHCDRVPFVNGFELDQTAHPMPRAVALVSKHCGEARVGAQACLSI